MCPNTHFGITSFQISDPAFCSAQSVSSSAGLIHQYMAYILNGKICTTPYLLPHTTLQWHTHQDMSVCEITGENVHFGRAAKITWTHFHTWSRIISHTRKQLTDKAQLISIGTCLTLPQTMPRAWQMCSKLGAVQCALWCLSQMIYYLTHTHIHTLDTLLNRFSHWQTKTHRQRDKTVYS